MTRKLERTAAVQAAQIQRVQVQICEREGGSARLSEGQSNRIFAEAYMMTNEQRATMLEELEVELARMPKGRGHVKVKL